ncbi:hypothetical protein LguiB_020971 [Lonicera macranthoides]
MESLTKLAKLRNLRNHFLPVFYDVSPSEIQKQKGRTGEAFDEYVKQYQGQMDHGRKLELMEKVNGWKEALEEVAKLAGMELKNQADGTTRSNNGQGKWWCTSVLMSWVPQPSRGPEILWTSLPQSLTNLSLSNCNLSNDSLPCEFGNLSLLKDLDLSSNSFHNLPDCVTSLSSLQRLHLSFCMSLDSIFGLPSNLQSLYAHHCSSLRKITFQSTPHQLVDIFVVCCRKMVEIEGIFKREPIGKVDERIIKNLGIDIEPIKNLEMDYVALLSLTRGRIQGFYEFGIFSTFIPRGEIPNAFSKRKNGSVISLIVPSLPNFRIQCCNICYVYARTDLSNWHYPIGIKINNKTKGLTWMYSPAVYGIPDVDENMTWLSQWNFRNQLEGGDEVVVSISMGDVFEVKECGINFINEEDNGVVLDDNNKTYFLWKKISAGDLSELRLRKGTYLVYRHLYKDVYEMQGINLLHDGLWNVKKLDGSSEIKKFPFPSFHKIDGFWFPATFETNKTWLILD